MDVSDTSEREGWALPGVPVLILEILLVAATIVLVVLAAATQDPLWLIPAAVLGLAVVLAAPGFVVVQPNQGSVLIVFGSYQGTIREPGLWWTNPLSIIERRLLSLRARNFNSQTSKVNDANGNPLNIAAVVVWQVVDTAQAVFDVDDYEDFVVVQSETAVRHLARSYPYDAYGEDDAELTLTGNAEAIAVTLTEELQARLSAAGVRVIEARLTDLAYAPEIAEAMLRRQQASAIVAARSRIVEGAVGMVQLALDAIEQGGMVELDDECKATMVSNLLTVLTSDQPTNPVVNVGTLSR